MNDKPAKTVPTAHQQRLLNIGMVLQFHLAAVGHVLLWLVLFFSLSYDVPYDPDTFVTRIAVGEGIPISFGVLVAVYIFFRILLAKADFSNALITMIVFNILHSIIMSPLLITPLRLLVPTILYAFALRRPPAPLTEAGPPQPEPADVS